MRDVHCSHHALVITCSLNSLVTSQCNPSPREETMTGKVHSLVCSTFCIFRSLLTQFEHSLLMSLSTYAHSSGPILTHAGVIILAFLWNTR